MAIQGEYKHLEVARARAPWSSEGVAAGSFTRSAAGPRVALPTRGTGPAVVLRIEWGAAQIAIKGAGMAGQAEPGDPTAQRGPALMIATGEDLETIVFDGVDAIAPEANAIFALAHAARAEAPPPASSTAICSAAPKAAARLHARHRLVAFYVKPLRNSLRAAGSAADSPRPL